MTRTYVIMEVSLETYSEIRTKLLDAGYNHALHVDSHQDECLDMQGIALAVGPPESVIVK